MRKSFQLVVLATILLFQLYEARNINNELKSEERELNKLDKALHSEERDIVKLEKALKHEERELKPFDKDLKTEEREVERVDKDLKAEERELNPVEKVLKTEEREIERLDKDLKAEERETRPVEKALKSEEREVERLEKDLKAEERELKPFDKALKSEEREVERVDKDLKAEERELNPVEKNLKTEEREVEKVNKALKKEQRELGKVEKSLKTEERELKKLNKKLAQEERKLVSASLKSEVEDVPARQSPSREQRSVKSTFNQGHNQKKKVNLRIVANDKEIKVREDIKKQIRRALLSNPIEADETRNGTIINLCENTVEFKYYIAHPVEETKYIQCNPWGTAEIFTCENGKIWDAWQLKCEHRENIKNLTALWSRLEMNIRSNLTINCSLPEFQCKNNGVCTQFGDEFKCVCSQHFSGDFCEIQTDFSYSLYREIMNSSFSLRQYEENLMKENVTYNFDLSYYEKYRADLGNETYELLLKYLSNFNETSIRYDTMLNFLVEDILKEIYPDSYFLTQFNASSQNIVAMVRMIPSLISYATYSVNRYENVFLEYQKVLDRVLSLYRECPIARREATDYLRMTSLFLNQTFSGLNMTSNERNDAISDISLNTKLTEQEIKERIRNDFNVTLQNSVSLIETLSEFQKVVVREMERDASIVRLTVGEFRSNCTVEVMRLFDDISRTSSQIWESLTSYGFWYITNSLSDVKFEERV